jgi:hypothetical protein
MIKYLILLLLLTSCSSAKYYIPYIEGTKKEIIRNNKQLYAFLEDHRDVKTESDKVLAGIQLSLQRLYGNQIIWAKYLDSDQPGKSFLIIELKELRHAAIRTNTYGHAEVNLKFIKNTKNQKQTTNKFMKGESKQFTLLPSEKGGEAEMEAWKVISDDIVKEIDHFLKTM